MTITLFAQFDISQTDSTTSTSTPTLDIPLGFRGIEPPNLAGTPDGSGIERGIVSRLDTRSVTVVYNFTDLKNAIIAANSTHGETLIYAYQGTYVFTKDGANTYALSIEAPITIVGVGPGNIEASRFDVLFIRTVSDPNSFSLFRVQSPYSLTLQNLSLTNGGGTAQNHGGAIFVSAGATAKLYDVRLTNNTVTNKGGAVYLAPGTTTSAKLVLTNVSFIDNQATKGAAIYGSDVSVVNLKRGNFGDWCAVFADNHATTNGGAVFSENANSAKLTRSAFGDNTTSGNYYDFIHSPTSEYNVAVARFSSFKQPNNGSLPESTSPNVKLANSGDVLPLPYPAVGVPTPNCEEPEICTNAIECELRDTYGIRIDGPWDPSELSVMLDGVKKIADAFDLISSSPLTKEALFRRVMGTETETTRITVILDEDPAFPNGYCLTENDFRRITCFGPLLQPGNLSIIPFTEQVFVHEFGHVFDARAGLDPFESLSERMDSGIVIKDCSQSQARVMGEVFDSEDPFNLNNYWNRGERGWGSGPTKYNTTTALITSYQQNPLLLHFQLTAMPAGQESAAKKSDRVQEAAADMFLNWVYKRLQGTPPQTNCTDIVPGPTPFTNKSWSGLSGSAPVAGNDDVSRPGSQRFLWMYNEMLVIFSQQGW